MNFLGHAADLSFVETTGVQKETLQAKEGNVFYTMMSTFPLVGFYCPSFRRFNLRVDKKGIQGRAKEDLHRPACTHRKPGTREIREILQEK